MKVTTQDREGLFKSLEVEVEGETVKTVLDEVYEYLKQNAEVEGFRKGSVPLWLIRARFKGYIEEQVGKKVADKTLQQAIEESKLTPVADIYLEEIKLEEKIPKLTYRVIFEVPPSFELKDVEGLEVEVPKLVFSEEAVKNRIESLREEHAVWEPVEDRGVEEGDLVTIEYEVTEITDKGEGEKVTGETSGIVGQKMFREELEKALIGKKPDEEIYLENVPLYDQEGKEVGRANIKAKVKDIKRKVLPELNDDFAKELGYENWEEAQKKIAEQVREDFEKVKRSMIEDAVADKLVEIHDFEVPVTLLRREIAFLIEKRVKDLQSLGVDTRYLDYKAMAEDFKPVAEANIKLRYILDKYAEEKNIEVTEEDIEKQFEELAQQMGTTKEEVKEYFQKENLMNVVEEDARRKKALEEIVSKARIKEVEKKEENQEEAPQEEEKEKS